VARQLAGARPGTAAEKAVVEGSAAVAR
jgi:hypothetical protein